MENALCLLYDLCRLCLDVPGTHNIFENDQLIQDILLCTGILQISCHDNKPQTICTECMSKIETAKDLRHYATTNDLLLRSLILDDGVKHKIAKPRTKIFVTATDELVSSSTEKENRRSEPQKSQDSSTDSKNNASITMKQKNYDNDRDTKIHRHKVSSPSTSSKPDKEVKSPEMKRAKISVRSLEEINSDKSLKVVTSSKVKHISPKRERRVSSSRSSVGKASGCSSDLKCDICGKTYLTQKKLYLHQRSHSKHLYCPLDACGKSFATNGDLQKHIRAHTGEKPYKCNLCDRSFAQNCTLKYHREAIHKMKIETDP